MEFIEVSLVIPVYNGEKYLGECIDSVVGQTCIDHMEIIIIDDGSTDHTPDICDTYADQYKNITVIHQKNQGLVNARKEGTKRAKGRFITFVDADDWIDKDYVEKMVDMAFRYGADMVVSGVVFEYPQKGIKAEYCLPAGLYDESSISEFKRKYIYSDIFFKFGTCVCIWGKIFPLEKYQEYQLKVPGEVQMGEDVAVTVPYVADITAPIVILDNTYYHYRQLESSMVHQHNNPEREEQTMLLYSVIDRSLEEKPELLQRMEYYKASMLIGLLKNNIQIANDNQEKIENVRRVLENEYYQNGLKQIDYGTMGLKYRFFFVAVKMKLSRVVMMALQRLK